jgi:hypothetical protein
MQYDLHKLVKNACTSYYVKHDGTEVPHSCGMAGKQANEMK